jgi:hypothetical protein
MSDSYGTFKVGDEVYFIENRWMAFCRIKKIIRDQSRPDYTKYVLEILKLPHRHEHFLAFNKILKHFWVGHSTGVYYSGMWRFYSPQQFEKYYGDYRVVMISWARYVIPRLIAFAVFVIIFILTIGGCYELFGIFPLFR